MYETNTHIEKWKILNKRPYLKVKCVKQTPIFTSEMYEIYAHIEERNVWNKRPYWKVKMYEINVHINEWNLWNKRPYWKVKCMYKHPYWIRKCIKQSIKTLRNGKYYYIYIEGIHKLHVQFYKLKKNVHNFSRFIVKYAKWSSFI